MTEEEREAFLEGVDKKVLWEMAEGKAEAKTDITSGGDKITFGIAEAIAKKNDIITKTEWDSGRQYAL